MPEAEWPLRGLIGRCTATLRPLRICEADTVINPSWQVRVAVARGKRIYLKASVALFGEEDIGVPFCETVVYCWRKSIQIFI